MKAFGMSKEEFNKLFEQIFYPTLPYRSISKNYDIATNVNSEICSKCGGICCKQCGCQFSPDDFQEISFEFLKQELEKGYISIDYVDGEMIYDDIGVYILRTRNINSPIVDTERFLRQPCILLTENGCKLDYEHRPTGGKLLIPSDKFTERNQRKCRSNYNIHKCCYEWKPHQKILHDLVEYFRNKDFPCSL